MDSIKILANCTDRELEEAMKFVKATDEQKERALKHIKEYKEMRAEVAKLFGK